MSAYLQSFLGELSRPIPDRYRYTSIPRQYMPLQAWELYESDLREAGNQVAFVASRQTPDAAAIQEQWNGLTNLDSTVRAHWQTLQELTAAQIERERHFVAAYNDYEALTRTKFEDSRSQVSWGGNAFRVTVSRAHYVFTLRQGGDKELVLRDWFDLDLRPEPGSAKGPSRQAVSYIAQGKSREPQSPRPIGFVLYVQIANESADKILRPQFATVESYYDEDDTAHEHPRYMTIPRVGISDSSGNKLVLHEGALRDPDRLGNDSGSCRLLSNAGGGIRPGETYWLVLLLSERNMPLWNVPTITISFDQPVFGERCQLSVPNECFTAGLVRGQLE